RCLWDSSCWCSCLIANNMFGMLGRRLTASLRFLPWKPEAVEDGEEFGIELRADEHGGTGVYARHRLQPGEVLAQIPTSALLYSARARQALPASCATLPLTEEELLGGGA
ncbi:unnamed protein product, partial [Effrenium voratum]